MQPRVVAASQEYFEKVGTGRQKSCNVLCLLAQGYRDTMLPLVAYSVGKQLKKGGGGAPTELSGGWPEAR